MARLPPSIRARARVLSLVLTILLGHSVASRSAESSSAATPVRQLTWEMLLPEAERNVFSSVAPSPVHDYLGEGSTAALQTGSYDVNPLLDGHVVRIPGFVVPLETVDNLMTEFLLVPYFGACIHVPPPPPNQVVHVKMRAGVPLRSIEDAQWVTGKLHARTRKSSLAAAAYILDGERMEVYRFTSP